MPTKQASQIEDFVAQHVAAILVAPCDSNAIVPALAGPEQAGIPVFTADIAAHGGKIVSHVASDNMQGGGLAADALAGFMGGKGKVIIIDHPTVASVQDRVKGFEDAMKKYPGISIVAKPSADGQRPKAAQVMEDMLQAHRDITGRLRDQRRLGAGRARRRHRGRAQGHRHCRLRCGRRSAGGDQIRRTSEGRPWCSTRPGLVRRWST